MINLEFVRLAWESVRSHKLRSALTLLGMVIGVFAIIVAVTAVEVIKSSATGTVESFGATTFTVSSRHGFQQRGGRWRPRRNLTYDEAERLAKRSRASNWDQPGNEEGFWGRGTRRWPEDRAICDVPGKRMNSGLAATGLTCPRAGFWENRMCIWLRPVAVIGADVEDELFPNEKAIGKDIVIDGYRYSVIGVMAEKGDAFGQNVDMIALVPITRMINLYSAARRDIDIAVRAPSMQDLEATMDETIGILRVIRGVGPGEENDFEAESNQSIVEQIGQFTGKIAHWAARR